MNDILMDYVCEELEDVEREGLKAGNLDSTDKLVNIKKNLMKIQMYEDEMGGEYSSESSYDDGMSYAGGGNSSRGYSRAGQGGGNRSGGGGGGGQSNRGGYSSRRRYSREGGMMSGSSYRGGSSYAGQRRDSMGRYSREEAKMGMIEQLEVLMEEAPSQKERKVIEEAMAKLEKA